MAIERERKYIARFVPEEAGAPRSFRQGYLSTNPEIRVRRIDDGDGQVGYLTVKFGTGLVRAEFEYAIPIADADDLLSRCEHQIDKLRHVLVENGRTWEIDQYRGQLEGLIIAELESDEENEPEELPTFIGLEVTDDPRYKNSALAEGLCTIQDLEVSGTQGKPPIIK